MTALAAPLSAADWDCIGDLFHRALALPSESRCSFVSAESRNRARIAEEVHQLLRYHETDSDLLERPLVDSFIASLAAPPPVPAAVTADFEILGVLGSGAFAQVYLAEERKLGRKVALKVSTFCGGEPRMLARLDHTNIVKIYSEVIDGTQRMHTIVMQYVPGCTLTDIIAQYRALVDENGEREPGFLEVLDRATSTAEVPFDPAALRDRESMRDATFSEGLLLVALQLLDALEHAHRQAILHLDLKPANVLLTSYGRAYLADFNVSASYAAIEAGDVSNWGGTPTFMAPEQAAVFRAENRAIAVQAVSDRADLYAMGRILLHAEEAVGRPLWANAHIQEILARLTATLPADRYGSTSEVRSALRNHLHLRKVHKEFGRSRIPASWMFLVLLWVAVIPVMVGSFANFAYGALRVVPALSPALQHGFYQTHLWVNLLSYPVAVGIYTAYVWPLRRAYRIFTAEERARLRAVVLRAPRVIWIVTSMGWLPGTFGFPVIVQTLSGSEVMSDSAKAAFAVGFVLAWIIVTSFGLLYTQSLLVKRYYPELLQGEEDAPVVAARELAGIMRSTRLLPSLAGMVPIVGAALAVLTTADDFTLDQFRQFRVMVVLLIGLGIAGLLLAMRSAAGTERAIRVLSSR